MANRLPDDSIDKVLELLNDPAKPVSTVTRLAVVILLLELKEQRTWTPAI